MNCSKYNSKKLWVALLSQALIACALSGCGGTDAPAANTGQTDSNTTVSSEVVYLDGGDMFTDRDKEVGYDESRVVAISLADGASFCDSSAVAIKDDTVTISGEGTYLLSGSLSNGQLIIDAPAAKVWLILDNVTINCDTSAAIYAKQADKVFLTTAEGSANSLTNTSAFAAIDDSNIDAVIFAKCDLTLNGSGTLDITARYGHGVVSKDDLVVTGGTWNVNAAEHALSGKDSVRIADGVLNLTAGTDGIHSENTNKLEKGFIYVAGGSIHITSESDGLDADYTVQIEGGDIEVAAGDDGIHSDSDLIITDGTICVTKSYEGLEGKTVTIEGGDIQITAEDDGINAAGEGKTIGDSADTQTDSANASADTAQTGGATPDGNMGTPPDGMGTPPNGGDFTAPAGGGMGSHPDGNRGTHPNGRSGAAPNGDMGGMGGFDEATDYNRVTIGGGTLYVDAGGDGIDSNGDLTVTGGEIYICGPENSGNGALDFAGNGTITGGTLIAAGTSGMAQNFGTDSTQGAMLVTVSGSMVTGTLSLTDADDNVLVTFDPAKSYNSVLISCASLTEGASYTLTAGDTTSTVEMSSLIYGSGGMGFPPR